MQHHENLDEIYAEIYKINNELRLIGINARIEASKASKEDGRRFSIIAEEMSKSSNKLNGSLDMLQEYIKKDKH